MLKALARRALPAWAKRELKEARRWWRRRQWEQRVRENPELHFHQADLEDQLRALGVTAGRDLLVHSAMSKLGFVEGGADTLLAALRNVVGPNATLLFPSYPMTSNMLDTMRDPTPFDVAKTKSQMGKMTETFRHKPGALRSAHPTHAIAAEGPAAADYVRDHHRSLSPAGAGSPFQLLSDRGGAILCLGSGIGKVTSHHVIEDRHPKFPKSVYLPELYEKLVRWPDGREELVKVRVHDPKLAGGRVDNFPEKEAQILAEMRNARIVAEGTIGVGRAHLFGAADLDTLHQALIARGITIYSN